MKGLRYLYMLIALSFAFGAYVAPVFAEDTPPPASGGTNSGGNSQDTSMTGCITSSGLFEGLVGTGIKIYNGLRDLIYIVAGFGILGVAVGGFFGNLNWKWLGAIVISLVVIASTGELVDMIIGCKGFTQNMITDTLNTDSSNFATFAESTTSLLTLALYKGINTFKDLKIIIFIVGGFGLVGVAFGAIFGKINWKWFAALVVGLAALAAAGGIVTYITGDTTTIFYGDTFETGLGETRRVTVDQETPAVPAE